MTEEQRKQCEEIYKRYIYVNIGVAAALPPPVNKDKWVKITISLAKVFNKDITEKEAEKILMTINFLFLPFPQYIPQYSFWAIANYFDNEENKINNVVKDTAKEKIMSKEEQYKKCEEIINSYEEKYNKDLEEALYKIKDIPEIPEMPESEIKMVKNYISALLFYYDKSDSEWNITTPLHLEPIPQDKAKAKFYELLAEPRNKTVENIIDLTVSLSEVFGSGITKEEAEKLLFTKKSIEIDGTLSYLNIFTGATEKFIKIMQSHEKGYLEYENYEEEINSIKNIGGAIANRFDMKNNDLVSKKFIVKNWEFHGRGIIEYQIAIFMKGLDGEVKIENDNYKIVKATSFLKIITLGIRYNDKFTIYCYGENKEKNLKEIEKYFKSIEIYPIEENKNFNNENKINKVVENTAKEKIMSNNDELILNLLILGKTGTGKSSLVNALIGEEVAKVSDAEPETDDIYPYPAEIDGKKITIYDSWGMEVGKEKIWDDIVNKQLKERGIDKPIKEWFHSVTYCIQAGGNRIEDFDAKIITKFIKGGYKVIVALTKAEQMGREDREKFIERIKERIKKEIEKEGTANDININDIIVISVSASPKKLDYMTEAPKLFGLEEYKAAILISWRELFIDKIPRHIIEKLKKDIEKAKSNAPREGKVKELGNKIQEYFINILKTNIQIYIRENIEEYYKINIYLLTVSKNIDISNLNLRRNIDDTTYIFSAFDFNYDALENVVNIVAMVLLAPLTIISGLIDLISLIAFNIKKSEKINDFINEVSQKIIDKISEKEFESEIRKVIIDALNEIDKKTIKLN